MGYKPDSHKSIFSNTRTKLVLLFELSLLSSMAEGLQQMQPIMPQINPNKPPRNSKRIKSIHVLTETNQQTNKSSKPRTISWVIHAHINGEEKNQDHIKKKKKNRNIDLPRHNVKPKQIQITSKPKPNKQR